MLSRGSCHVPYGICFYKSDRGCRLSDEEKTDIIEQYDKIEQRRRRTMKKLMVIDGNSIINRAFYGGAAP